MTEIPVESNLTRRLARLVDSEGYWIYIIVPSEQRYYYQNEVYEVKGILRPLKMKNWENEIFVTYAIEVESMHRHD